jgi:hypothetical protein
MAKAKSEKKPGYDVSRMSPCHLNGIGEIAIYINGGLLLGKTMKNPSKNG